MKLFLSPHNDDEVLFGAFTLIREKPLVLVVTDSFIQPNRGDFGCDATTRRKETIQAMEILGCPVAFLGIRDDTFSEGEVLDRLKYFSGLEFERCYAPAVQGGNWQHDAVSRAADRLWGGKCRFYTTYTKTELWTKGTEEIIPTPEEKELKEKALWCYQSQIKLPSTRPHFEAVMDKSEWLI